VGTVQPVAPAAASQYKKAPHRVKAVQLASYDLARSAPQRVSLCRAMF
jgi:hypothetical protein